MKGQSMLSMRFIKAIKMGEMGHNNGNPHPQRAIPITKRQGLHSWTFCASL